MVLGPFLNTLNHVTCDCWPHSGFNILLPDLISSIFFLKRIDYFWIVNILDGLKIVIFKVFHYAAKSLFCVFNDLIIISYAKVYL